MAARGVWKVGKFGFVASLAGTPVYFKVYAASSKRPNCNKAGDADEDCDDRGSCAPCDCKPKRVKIADLPVYNKKDDNRYVVQEEEITGTRKYVEIARKTFCKVYFTIEKSLGPVKDMVITGYDHTMGYIDYLQNDPATLPRAGFITVAGLGGFIAGYRGGMIRKLFFASTAMGAAAALCYPKEAVNCASFTYCQAWKIWEDAKSVYGNLEADDISKKKDEAKKESASSASEGAKPSAKKVAVEGDLGQSNPSDKDLYTTRS